MSSSAPFNSAASTSAASASAASVASISADLEAAQILRKIRKLIQRQIQFSTSRAIYSSYVPEIWSNDLKNLLGRNLKKVLSTREIEIIQNFTNSASNKKDLNNKSDKTTDLATATNFTFQEDLKKEAESFAAFSTAAYATTSSAAAAIVPGTAASDATLAAAYSFPIWAVEPASIIAPAKTKDFFQLRAEVQAANIALGTKILEYFVANHDPNNTIDQFCMGYCYDLGITVSINSQLAFHYYSQAAEKNHPSALRRLARLHESGTIDKPKDTKLADECCNRAIKLGDDVAIYNRAQELLDENKGTVQDKKDIIELLKVSAEKGIAVNLRTLAREYVLGRFVQKDLKKAWDYYVLAAVQGDVFAALNLNQGLRIGVEECNKDQDRLTIFYVRLIASEYNCPKVLLELANINPFDLQGKGDKKTFKCMELAIEAAKKYLNLAVEADKKILVEAHMTIAEYCQKGLYTKKNAIKALQHYTAAANLGSATAHYILGNLYRRGVDVPRNLDLATYHFQESTRDGRKPSLMLYNLPPEIIECLPKEWSLHLSVDENVNKQRVEIDGGMEIYHPVELVTPLIYFCRRPLAVTKLGNNIADMLLNFCDVNYVNYSF